MTEHPFEDWAQEFLASPAAEAFRGDVQEAGALALPAFLEAACRRASGGWDGLESGHLARALSHDLHGLGLPAGTKPQIPALAAAFLGFLQDTGRLADGAALGEALFAGTAPLEDRAPAPSAGRNDPCPCGSGRKYKKCCGA